MNIWGSRLFFMFLFILLIISTKFYAMDRGDFDTLGKCALDRFGKDTPGLFSLLLINQNKGAAFELAAALALADQKEEIIGFDLADNLPYQTEQIQIKKHNFQLQTTEFDIITKKFVIECKCGKNHVKKIIDQFIKEQTMIEWCQELTKEIAIGTAEIGFTFSKRNKTPFVIISSPSTSHNKISLTSSWFDTKDPQRCIEQFIYIVQELATKKVHGFFRNEVSDELIAKLNEYNIHYDDRAGGKWVEYI